MLINKFKYMANKSKKVLHKIKKQWVVVSVVLLGLLGGTAITTQVHINADENNSQPTITQQANQMHSNLVNNANQKPAMQLGAESNNNQQNNHTIHYNINNSNQNNGSDTNSSNYGNNVNFDLIGGNGLTPNSDSMNEPNTSLSNPDSINYKSNTNQQSNGQSSKSSSTSSSTNSDTSVASDENDFAPSAVPASDMPGYDGGGIDDEGINITNNLSDYSDISDNVLSDDYTPSDGSDNQSYVSDNNQQSASGSNNIVNSSSAASSTNSSISDENDFNQPSDSDIDMDMPGYDGSGIYIMNDPISLSDDYYNPSDASDNQSSASDSSQQSDSNANSIVYQPSISSLASSSTNSDTSVSDESDFAPSTIPASDMPGYDGGGIESGPQLAPSDYLDGPSDNYLTEANYGTSIHTPYYSDISHTPSSDNSDINISDEPAFDNFSDRNMSDNVSDLNTSNNSDAVDNYMNPINNGNNSSSNGSTNNTEIPSDMSYTTEYTGNVDYSPDISTSGSNINSYDGNNYYAQPSDDIDNWN